jgi:hypothetical protein
MAFTKLTHVYKTILFNIFKFTTYSNATVNYKFYVMCLKFLSINQVLFFSEILKQNNNEKLTRQNNYFSAPYKLNNFVFIVKNSFSSYLSILTNNLKWLIVALFISVVYFFISLYYIQVDLTKQLAVWFIVLIIYYLLMSTFNSFLVKYKYGKFTSAIQRFWKRTNMIFWLIEGFLFLLFFYYFLNSSQEPLYFFDYSSLNQELLIQLKSSYKNMLLLSVAIYLSFVLILNNNFLNYYQNIILLAVISLIVFYMLYVESYQFVYTINLFADKDWIFDDVKRLWILEVEQNNIRVKQQYFILCLIAKYWHFIFIFISWFFFLLKSIEINKINYTLMGYNVQNLLILYVLNLMCLVQWGKWVFKKFIEITYSWFHIQYDEKLIAVIRDEILLFFQSITSLNTFTFNVEKLFNYSNTLLFSNEINMWKYTNCPQQSLTLKQQQTNYSSQ